MSDPTAYDEVLELLRTQNKELTRLRGELAQAFDAAHTALTLLSNVGGGNIDGQSESWKAAFTRWQAQFWEMADRLMRPSRRRDHEIQRYELDQGKGYLPLASMVPDTSGDWVKYDDYLKAVERV